MNRLELTPSKIYLTVQIYKQLDWRYHLIHTIIIIHQLISSQCQFQRHPF